MLTHDRIWNAIDSLAAQAGYSTSGLAKSAGLDPTSFNRSKRFAPDGKPRWPSTESISLILIATETSFTEFAELVITQTNGEAAPPVRVKANAKKPKASSRK